MAALASLCLLAVTSAANSSGRSRDAPVDHGPRDEKRVALTFDTCSGPPPGKLDEGVVAVLEDAGVGATFFVGGRWAEQDPTRLKRLSDNPRFEIESHTYRHKHLTEVGDGELKRELTEGSAVLTKLTGKTPTYVRAPYGEADGRVVRAARAAGLTVIGFDLASGDPDPSFNARRLSRWVLRAVRSGSIVVMHANGRGWHTAEALPTILGGLADAGYRLVTVGELLGATPAADAGAGGADNRDGG